VSWRRLNAVLAALSFVLLVAMCALWLVAWWDGFIGDTAFIGHVSMLALVLACGGLMTGFIAAWRSDVPTQGEE
jgi:Na+-transporting NADH:ubiquinone oxidoreductase subunit NqrB